MSQHAQVGMIVEPQDRVLSSDTGTTYLNNTLSNIVLVGATDANLERSGLVAESSLDRDEGEKGQGGYEYSAGFADRTTGASGVSSIGSNVSYPQSLVDTQTWMRFGFDETRQAANDFAYWTDDPVLRAAAAGRGTFAGQYLPANATALFDYGFSDPAYSSAGSLTEGELYTAADGSYDFTSCVPGDLGLIRFDFNIVPQVANTTLEVCLIWATRDSDDVETYSFPLVGAVSFFGTGTVGRTFLQRPLITAYFAGPEDVNARALPAIRADNPVEIQPLATLASIVR